MISSGTIVNDVITFRVLHQHTGVSSWSSTWEKFTEKIHILFTWHSFEFGHYHFPPLDISLNLLYCINYLRQELF